MIVNPNSLEKKVVCNLDLVLDKPKHAIPISNRIRIDECDFFCCDGRSSDCKYALTNSNRNLCTYKSKSTSP